jgi:hypothetical protein
MVTEMITVFVLLSISNSSKQRKESTSSDEEEVKVEGYEYAKADDFKMRRSDINAGSTMTESFVDHLTDNITGVHRPSLMRRLSNPEVTVRMSETQVHRFEMRQAIFCQFFETVPMDPLSMNATTDMPEQESAEVDDAAERERKRREEIIQNFKVRFAE